MVERDGRRLDLSPLEYALLVTLLQRPRQIQVGLARKEIEPVAQRLLITADEGVNIIARQEAETIEQREDFNVALPELRDYIGNRAEAGRLPPKGFPKSNRFEG